MKDGGVIGFRAVKACRVRQMQGIGGGHVAGMRMPVEDRWALRHGVHEMGTPLDGREAVREDGDRWEGHAVELVTVQVVKA
jgi:hypothetical protein